MAKKSPRTYETAFAFYREVRVIGEGGCGTVFEVVDDAGKVVAAVCREHATAALADHQAAEDARNRPKLPEGDTKDGAPKE